MHQTLEVSQMHVHILFLVSTVGMFLITTLHRSSDQSRAFRSTNCQSPRFVQQVYRVLFGHPILGRFVIVVSSGRFFQDPQVLFRASRCVCVRCYCFCVNYITRIYHFFLDLFLTFLGKVSAMLTTRTTCCPADLLKNFLAFRFFLIVLNLLLLITHALSE